MWGDCSLPQKDSKASVPRASAGSHMEHQYQVLGSLPRNFSESEKPTLNNPLPWTGPGLLPSQRAQHSHTICLLPLSILQKAETNKPWDSNECSSTHREQDTEGSSRDPVLYNFFFQTKYNQVTLTHQRSLKPCSNVTL